MRRSLYLAGALTLAAGVLPAQQSARTTRDAYDDRDRAAIGVTTSSGGMRDTLGLLVQSVTAGSPADKAGIEEGNRLISVNGVSLRLSAADAGEGDMDGIANRRLIRELEKVKAGDEVELIDLVKANGVTAFALELTVPPNTTAEVSLPDGSAAFDVGSGRHAFERTVVPVAPVEKPQDFNWHPDED